MSAPNTSRFNAQKFAMWAGMAGMIMLFASLTSAYLVRKGGGNWQLFRLPWWFALSTVVVISSSVTLWLATKAFKREQYLRYRRLVGLTTALGLAFLFCQVMGFRELIQNGLYLSGNPSVGFMYVISGLHAVHLLGGLITLLVLFILSYRQQYNPNHLNRLEITGIYWHFVDILWVYLFIFFQINL